MNLFPTAGLRMDESKVEPTEVAQFGRYEFSLYDANTFSVAWELVSGRGAIEKAQLEMIDAATIAVASGRIHALTITDNPGGNPAISAEMLGVEIRSLGIEPLVHLTCKDKNRNQLESLLNGMERADVRNLLVMSGDYPKAGYGGAPKPVFDLDPITLLGLISELNKGREVPKLGGKTTLKSTRFFAGVAASPFKALEAEQMGQYYKLRKKLTAGARFVVSQLGFDARKIHELFQVMQLLGFGNIPVVGNIYLLPLGTAKLMNRNGLPGCVVPDKLLRSVQAEAAGRDKGRAKRVERAAKMYALLKGMGYAGAHISGHGMTVSDLLEVIEHGEELSQRWQDFVHEFDYPQENGWYYFERDEKTGLNTMTPVSREAHSSAGIGYFTLRMLHHLAFTKEGALFRPMRALARMADGSALESAYTKCEQIIKGLTNDCRHCGDCAMLDVAYLCPMSQCPKNQRNGPCGGSYEGWCEAYPNQRKCIYVLAYERLKAHGADQLLGENLVPPVNYDLNETSSWINFYLGRDHSASKLEIETVARKKKSKTKNLK
ncbi:MAG: methylenetetrahydrofolate reductase C-terminal domain-containing protein [Terracidiphilus sp.]